MKTLLIGCGHSRVRKIAARVEDDRFHGKLVTLDINPEVKPDVVHNLNVFPYPFRDNEFDEIHAYDVLEHCGSQGDYVYFFKQFTEFWRIMRPGGKFYAAVPPFNSQNAFGDPGHVRVFSEGLTIFLSQKEYKRQIDVRGSNMTDYRNIYKADFDILHQNTTESAGCVFVLKVVK